MGRKRQYYFMYKGTEVNVGTIIKIKPWHGSPGDPYIDEVTFKYYVPEIDLYVIKYTSPYGNKEIGMYGSEFKKYLVHPTGKIDESTIREYQMAIESNRLTFLKELHVDGMLIAWMWYIVLMCITLIFNGFICYWIVISICFFIYRNNKLREAGYK